jgi:hypothetical protein
MGGKAGRSRYMKRVSLIVASTLLILACVLTPQARASCVSAVIVDGAVLIGHDASDWTLPRTAGQMPAVDPACNDGGPRQPDSRTTVVRFAGVPADIAVRSVDGSDVYIADGSLTALAAHPLHRSYHRLVRRNCARKSTLGGTAGTTGFDSIELIAGGRSHFYRVDARTALVNRPAYQPIRRGQQLSIAASRCGTRLIADRITFTGPTIVPKRYTGQTDSALGAGLPWGIAILIGALGLALAAWLIERVTRP